MSRRIYWLIPDVASARRTVDDLLLARVPVQHIHCAGREGMDLSGLHPANVLQTTDVIYAAEAGLLIGGTVGIAAGLLVAMYYPLGIDSLQWGVVAVLGGLGALFGAWSSSMIGISVPSHRLGRPSPRTPNWEDWARAAAGTPAASMKRRRARRTYGLSKGKGRW